MEHNIIIWNSVCCWVFSIQFATETLRFFRPTSTKNHQRKGLKIGESLSSEARHGNSCMKNNLISQLVALIIISQHFEFSFCDFVVSDITTAEQALTLADVWISIQVSGIVNCIHISNNLWLVILVWFCCRGNLL